ncbi:hypothetical protein F2Q68_00015332 [Brassica cretica]|uniref:Dymeclin n=1 Tax=Brassica cretica TaxID=69181 RepID=A0A8S9HQM9_BRACR|nr:hypothetical protein F2Q68_00015332 [Brassica cretica]
MCVFRQRKDPRRRTTTTRLNFIDVSSVFALFLIFTITDSDYALVDPARLKEEETWEARRRCCETQVVVMMFSVAEYLITTFVGEKSFPLASDFWNKLLELPSSFRWPSDLVHQACELFAQNNGYSRHLAKLLIHLSWYLQELLQASDDDQASIYKKAVNTMYIASVFLKHLIENGKSERLEELLSGPSPGPRDANPFIDAAMSQEKSLVFLAVRRLLLKYIFRSPPNAKGYLYSDGDSPGILERVGSAAGRFVKCSMYS